MRIGLQELIDFFESAKHAAVRRLRKDESAYWNGTKEERTKIVLESIQAGQQVVNSLNLGEVEG